MKVFDQIWLMTSQEPTTTTHVIGRNRRLRPGHANVTERERSQGENIDQTLTVLRFSSPHNERSQARTSGWASNSVFSSSPFASRLPGT